MAQAETELVERRYPARGDFKFKNGGKSADRVECESHEFGRGVAGLSAKSGSQVHPGHTCWSIRRAAHSQILVPNNPALLQLMAADALESMCGPLFSRMIVNDDVTVILNSNESIIN